MYHDKNTDTEEYDDYHIIEGFPTPFTITRLKNDDTVRQYYVTQVIYQPESAGGFLGSGRGGAEDRRSSEREAPEHNPFILRPDRYL